MKKRNTSAWKAEANLVNGASKIFAEQKPSITFFYFKKIRSTVSVLQKSCLPRWPGLLRPFRLTCCVFSCAFGGEIWFSFLLYCLLGVCILNGPFISFFEWEISNWVVQLFCFVVLCILLDVFVCITHNCLRVCLPALMHFRSIYIIAHLSHFLQSFYMSINSLSIPYWSCLIFIVFAGFFLPSLARLQRFYAAVYALFLRSGLEISFAMWTAISFAIFLRFSFSFY